MSRAPAAAARLALGAATVAAAVRGAAALSASVARELGAARLPALDAFPLLLLAVATGLVLRTRPVPTDRGAPYAAAVAGAGAGLAWAAFPLADAALRLGGFAVVAAGFAFAGGAGAAARGVRRDDRRDAPGPPEIV